MGERYFFPKDKRLFLKKDIDRLFDKGLSFVSYPLRIIYLPYMHDTSLKSGTSVLVSVPKKFIKSAVKRNRLKRLIRESFRLNISKQKERQVHIAIMYISKEMRPYSAIENALLKALVIISNKVEG